MPASAKKSAERTLTSTRTFTSITPSMENILIGLIALGCLIYLIVAVLRPEKF